MALLSVGSGMGGTGAENLHPGEDGLFESESDAVGLVAITGLGF